MKETVSMQRAVRHLRDTFVRYMLPTSKRFKGQQRRPRSYNLHQQANDLLGEDELLVTLFRLTCIRILLPFGTIIAIKTIREALKRAPSRRARAALTSFIMGVLRSLKVCSMYRLKFLIAEDGGLFREDSDVSGSFMLATTIRDAPRRRKKKISSLSASILHSSEAQRKLGFSSLVDCLGASLHTISMCLTTTCIQTELIYEHRRPEMVSDAL